MNLLPDKKNSQSNASRAEISIWLDSYNDIFSDFYSRPISLRSLSDDFITQVKKTQRENKGDKVALRLLMPSALRKTEQENHIIERLRLYFNTIHLQLRDDARATNRKGLYFILVGIALMVTSGYISFVKSEKFHIHLLLVLFEPAGWFMLWTGLDHLIYFSTNKKSEVDFYRLMSNVEIEFNSY